MPAFEAFAMERWQSTWENRVAHNLSESGVHPLTVGELCALAGVSSLDETPLGYGQSNGSDTLRARIASLYAGAAENGVVVTNGSAEANFAALWELVQPGDEVAILEPTYRQARGLATMFGAQVRSIPLHEHAGWQPDPDVIAAAVGPRTRVVVVTNPGNPTGAVLTDDAVDAVCAAAARHGAWILADEVYAGAELNGTRTRSFFGLHDRVIATGSLSKAYGLPGLRIGWTVSDPATAERLWARTDYTTIAPGALTDALACLALVPDVRDRLYERTRAILHAGLDVLEPWLAAQECFTWRRPDAGAICFVRYDLPVAAAELAERLRAEHDVLIVPGTHFDMEGYLRFGYGLHTGPLRAALARTAALLAELRAAGAVHQAG